tara:strand:+ start:227 stop:502 length:276 start_codon:yes stop_codon:yes gene_type:complete
MRIDIKTLNKIQKEIGEFQVGAEAHIKKWSDKHQLVTSTLSLRFGYWQIIDTDKLISILPKYVKLVEELVDEDEFGKPLVYYKLIENRKLE